MKNTNSMSNLLKSLGLFLLLFVVVLSCKKEEDPVPEKQKANFEFANATVAENIGGTAQVNINLEKATVEAGTLTVSIANGTGVAYTTNYVTNPNGASGSFEIAVAKGATTASFTITPVDDTVENDARIITFTLSEATGGVELGDKKTLALSIIDNDTPAAVNFELATGAVAENAASALTVNLTLTTAAVNAGTFDVAYASDDAVYTTDFTTDPDGASGTFTVNVDAGATTATFTVMPVDNAANGADKTVTFTISNATGGVNIGQATTFALTIENDDNVTVKTIADIRALYDGSADVNLTEDWVIEGTVTSINDAATTRNLYIQDETAGIVIRWSENHSFTQGDKLSIKVKEAMISDYNDLVQITGTLPLANATVVSQGNALTPTVITLTQLNSGTFQAQYITVENVTFPAADGTITLSGNNDISDGSETAVVRVSSSATFSGDAVPLGTGNIIGVAGVFSGTNQILPQKSADVFANNPSAVITVTQNITDFGNVDTNASSVSQSYTVSGTTLTEDIVVTAPNQFEVSLDDVTFTASVSILAADAMAGDVTVYARFSPTAGNGGVSAGDIVHTTAGAISQSFSVSGTEVLANPPLFSETFETDGNGTRYTTSVPEFTDGWNDFFTRTDGSNINASFEYTGVTGSYFAACDMDGDGNPASNTLSFTGIDISGKTNLQFAISIAEDDDGTNQDWDADTQFIVEYQIDGGGYQNLFAVEAEGGTNTLPRVDTDFDGVGDGAEITAAFTEFTSAIAGTGTTLDIRINFNLLNAGDEDIAIDNIKVDGD